jgi:hypothetical protein
MSEAPPVVQAVPDEEETDPEPAEGTSQAAEIAPEDSSSVDASSKPPPANKARTAIPLALSSMARLDADQDTPGSLLGLYSIVHHALLACANLTPQLLTNGSGDWRADRILSTGIQPEALQTSLGFDQAYVRQCFLYDGTKLKELTAEAIAGWVTNPAILGCISLYYASQDVMEDDELVLSEDSDDDGDLPACVMFKATVEYKTVRRSSGNVQARQAEELSMLTFGASVDDDVKLGALSSLYDNVGKYRLEVSGVRQKTYTFDIADTVLSDGTVPTFPRQTKTGRRPSQESEKADGAVEADIDDRDEDPFVKIVAVSVKDNPVTEATSNLTRLSLSLEGKLRPQALENLEGFHNTPRRLREMFPLIGAPESVLAVSCGQALLIDREQASRVYINGKFMTRWGEDVRMGATSPALFGMEISHSVPVWHGRVVDYDQVRRQYAAMWQELLVDARHANQNLASRLLSRLIKGRDPEDMVDGQDEELLVPMSDDCLESEVMASTKYDPVGICAKALATRFGQEYGTSAFPCLEQEAEWVRLRLGRNTPVIVPLRALKILRRGGYFDVQRTTQEMWFAVQPASIDEKEQKILEYAIAKLNKAGCDDIVPSRVVFVDLQDQLGAIQGKLMCRYDSTTKQYYVNRHVMEMKEPALSLGLFLAQEHSDGYVLVKYMLENCTR